MKKYVIFASSAPQWLQLAIDLKDNNIAEPELWLADDFHYKNACEIFGNEKVKKLSDLRFNAPKHEDINYSGEFDDFFLSNDYLPTKDICMKMMDRLDDISMMSRLDKEVWFHIVCIWSLKRFSKSKPDFLIMHEAPHNHAQYLVFAICNFLEIPIMKFSGMLPIPILFSFLFTKGGYKKLIYTENRKSKSKFTDILLEYIDSTYSRVKTNHEIATHQHALKLKSDSFNFWLERKKDLFKNCFRFLKYPKSLFSKNYASDNPYGLGPIKKAYFIKKEFIY